MNHKSEGMIHGIISLSFLFLYVDIYAVYLYLRVNLYFYILYLNLSVFL